MLKAEKQGHVNMLSNLKRKYFWRQLFYELDVFVGKVTKRKRVTKD